MRPDAPVPLGAVLFFVLVVVGVLILVMLSSLGVVGGGGDGRLPVPAKVQPRIYDCRDLPDELKKSGGFFPPRVTS